MKKTIAIDFDGVIHKYSKGWFDGTIYDDPIDGVVEAIKALQRKYYVYVLTSRSVVDVVKWMNQKLPFETVAIPDDILFWNEDKIGVSNRKLPAMIYIDDRGVRFYSWLQVLEELLLTKTDNIKTLIIRKRRKR